MPMHLQAFGQHLVYHGIRRVKSKIPLCRLKRIRFHGIARGSDVVMHFEQFQPDAFQILGGNCVADQKIVLISCFYRNQILLDGNRAIAGRLKADIVNVKGGF
ncbi:hypothetical protein D3C80_1706530 [compost metagenome]